MKSTDYFDQSSPWFWTLQVLLNLYGLALFAFFVLVENASALDTYFHNWMGPGQYYSLRYVSLYWVILFLANAKVFMFPLVASMITYRRSRACSIGWFVAICAIAFCNVFTFVGLLTYMASANRNGAVDNPANHQDWCCLPEIYGDSNNGCPNPGACMPAVTSVHVHTDFVWYFAVTVAFVCADIFFVCFFSGLFGPKPLSSCDRTPTVAMLKRSKQQILPAVRDVKMTKGI